MPEKNPDAATAIQWLLQMLGGDVGGINKSAPAEAAPPPQWGMPSTLRDRMMAYTRPQRAPDDLSGMGY